MRQLAAVLLFGLVASAEGAGPGHPIDDPERCIACHDGAPTELPAAGDGARTLPAAAGVVGNGIDACMECHQGEQSHVVGQGLEFTVPADLPLGDDGSMTCLTCHHAHGSLVSKVPRASFSFMDRLLGDPGLGKSYLLRRSNVNGELCFVCHEPPG